MSTGNPSISILTALMSLSYHNLLSKSKIRVFQLSYMPFSSIGGRFSEPAAITVSAIIAIDELIVREKLIYLEQPIPSTHTPAPPATEVPPGVFGFLQNYNMHSMGKKIAELHVMLKKHEKWLPKKAPGAPTLIPPPPKKEHPVKDAICHYCGEVGHWRRNCLAYLAELIKKNKTSGASTSGIFIIELYSFPSKSWAYDTGCGTHIYNTTQGLRGSRKLKHGALNLYVGNENHATVEAIGSFDLFLPNGLCIVLDNCHYALSITRGVVLSYSFER
ncbi:zinc finger, CCHC-type containing protein [Tanacetum coccineum]